MLKRPFAAVFFAILGSCLILGQLPDRVVVTPDGEIEGALSAARAWFRGDDFWVSQLQIVDAELRAERAYPAKVTRWKREDAAWDRQLRLEESKFYRDHPDARPSQAEVAAQRLRERADAIESAELERSLEKIRLEEIRRLQAIKRAIEARSPSPSA